MGTEDRLLRSFFHFVLLVLCSSLIMSSCLDLDRFDDIDFKPIQGEFALPVFDSDLKLVEVLEKTTSDASASISPDGKITILYEGELLQRTANQIFPPIPADELILPDTTGVLEVNFPVEFISTRAVFKNNFAFFTFESAFDDPVDVKITFPQLTKDGVVFTKEYTIQPFQRFVSEFIPLTDWLLTGNLNRLDYSYEARRSNGERVTLPFASFKLDFLNFSYVEGFLDTTFFDFEGDFLPIGLFDSWESGDVIFTDPIVTLKIDNSFGFPVRTQAEEIGIETITGENIDLESIFVDEGIDIAYPDLSNIGDVEVTNFVLDNNNSNIDFLFGKKVKQFNYDMLAVAFPNGFGTLGYLTDSSFFKIRLALELPTETLINNLVLTNNFEISLDTLEEITAVEYILLGQNRYPIDLEVQGYFIDSNETIIDSLTDTSWLLFPGVDPSDPGARDTIRFTKKFDRNDINAIREATSVKIRTRYNTPQSIDEPIFLTNEQGLRLSMGVKGSYEDE